MRAVIQRVDSARVTIGDRVAAHIGLGLLILLGIEVEDTPQEGAWLAGKIVKLRLFPDDKVSMNRNVLEVGGDFLVVSQFTLLGSTQKGNRPSFHRAAVPIIAKQLYEQFLLQLESASGRKVEHGEFGAHMKVSLVNDGPVTLLLDSRVKE